MGIDVGDLTGSVTLEDQLSSALDKIKARLIAAGADWDYINSKVIQGGDAVSKNANLQALLQAELAKSQVAAKNFQGAMNEAAVASMQNANMAKQLEPTLRELSGEYAVQKDRVEALSSSTKILRDAFVDTSDKARITSQQIVAFGRGVQEAGIVLSTTVTAPLVAAGIAAIHFGGEFEAAQAKIVALAGASQQEVTSLSNSVMGLAKTVGIGPAELSQGLFVLESAGKHGSEAMKAIEISAKMAAVGMGSVEETTRAVIGAMLNYQKENLSAAQAGDIFTKTVQLGNMKVNDLVGALARVGPVAAAMGVKFADVNAAIATFTHLGASSEVAATGIRAVLSTLLNDGIKTEKGLKALGISMKDLRTEIEQKGLTEALLHLVDAADKIPGGMDKLQQVFPNIRALTLVLADAVSQGKNYADITNKIREGTGSLDAAFATIKNTWVQQFNELIVAGQVLAIQLGQDLLPTLKNLVSFVQSSVIPGFKYIVDIFTNLPSPLQTATLIFLGLFAALGPGLILVGEMIRSWGHLSTLLAAGDFAKMAPSIAGFITNLGNAQIATISLSTALGGLALAATAAFAAFELWEAGKQLFAWMHEAAQRQVDDNRQFVVDQGTLAAASKIAGHAITDLAEATSILTKKTQELQAQNMFTGPHLDAVTVSIKSLTEQERANIAIADLHNNKMKALSDAAMQVTRAYFAAGASAAETFKALKDQLLVTDEQKLAIERLHEAYTKHNHQLKEVADAELAARMALVPLTDAQTSEVARLLALKLGHETVARAIGIHVAQVQAYVAWEQQSNRVATEATTFEKRRTEEMKKQHEEGLKILEEGLKRRNKITLDELTLGSKAQVEYNKFVAQQTLTTTDFQIYEIQEWAREQHNVYFESEELAKRYYDEVDALAAARTNALFVDNKKILDSSRDNLFHLAGIARNTYETMKASPKEFSKVAIEQARQTAKESLDTARGITHPWQESFKSISAGLPSVVVSAMTSGGGLSGAGQGIGSFIGGHLGTGLVKNITSMAPKFMAGAMGQMLGAALPLVGSLVGPLMGAIIEHFHKPEWKKQMADVGRDWGVAISDNLAKELEQIEKSAHVGRVEAQLIDMAKIISEAGGLGAANIDKFTGKLHDVFSAIETHQLTIAQGTKILDENWKAFATVGTDSLGLLSDKLVDIINLNEHFGTQSKEITAYMGEQGKKVASGFNDVVNSIAGGWLKDLDTFNTAGDQLVTLHEKADKLAASMADLSKKKVWNEKDKVNYEIWQRELADTQTQITMLEGSTQQFADTWSTAAETGQDKFDRLSRLAFVSFNAAIAGGQSFVSALDSISPALDQLAQAQKVFGFQSTEAFQSLMQMHDFTKAQPDIAKAMSGLNDMLVGLHNTGLITQQAFDDIGLTAVDTFNKAQEKGLSANEAMVLMQPTLQTLWKLHKDNGLAVDDTTKSLLDQAEAQGVVGDKMREANERSAIALEKVVGLMENLLTAMGVKLPAAIDTAASHMQTFGDTAEHNLGRAEDGADAAARGASPGGVKEITTQLLQAQTALHAFAPDFIKSFDMMKAQADKLSFESLQPFAGAVEVPRMSAPRIPMSQVPLNEQDLADWNTYRQEQEKQYPVGQEPGGAGAIININNVIQAMDSKSMYDFFDQQGMPIIFGMFEDNRRGSGSRLANIVKGLTGG